jgi:hypothetical protein
MPAFKVTFHRCMQDSQEFGSDNEYMVSRVFFTLEVDGERKGDFSANLKQVVGSDAQTGEIEVSQPNGYDGPFDHQGFSNSAREYFRGLVGPQGQGIHIAAGRNVRMYNNEFRKDTEFRF